LGREECLPPLEEDHSKGARWRRRKRLSCRATFHWIAVQPISEKMRLEMVIGMESECGVIVLGLFYNVSFEKRT